MAEPAPHLTDVDGVMMQLGGRDGRAPAGEWPEQAWARLLAAIQAPELVWSGLPHCDVCRRPVAGPDCEVDADLCWGHPSRG